MYEAFVLDRASHFLGYQNVRVYTYVYALCVLRVSLGKTSGGKEVRELEEEKEKEDEKTNKSLYLVTIDACTYAL